MIKRPPEEWLIFENTGHQKIGKPDMINPIWDKSSLLITNVIKYELLKNQ